MLVARQARSHILARRLAEKRSPIARDRQQRRNLGQSVVAPAQVSRQTTPAAPARRSREARADRIPLPIIRRRRKVAIVHDKPGESPLSQAPPPILPEVDPPRVTSMRLAHRPTKAFLRIRHHDPMHVVRHPTAGRDRGLRLSLAAPRIDLQVRFWQMLISQAQKDRSVECSG